MLSMSKSDKTDNKMYSQINQMLSMSKSDKTDNKFWY